MKYRKQILIGLFATLVLYFLGDWLLEKTFFGPLAVHEDRTAILRRHIQARERTMARSRKARQKLTAWENQSLPSNVEVAQSLYQAWLLELVDYVGLSHSGVVSGTPVSKPGGYRVLSFSLRGRGSLQQLTTFLFEFYRAAHLHRIESLGISPIAKTDQLDLLISVQAVSLPGAARKDRLCTDTSNRLVYDDPAQYQVIARRNVFGIGGSPDVTEHTQLTGVTYDDGQPVAWFSVRTTGEIIKLGEQGSLELGTFAGTITEIQDTDVIIESDGQRWLLTIGDNLSEACALPPEF